MSTSQQEWLNKFCRPCAPEESEAFSRMDETEDSIFYSTDRFVSHLDKTALNTVEKIIGELVIEDEPVILDLMAGWDSHIPDTAALGKTIGLGLNKNELEQNKALDNYVIHDINTDPDLPFEDNSFDVVLNTVSRGLSDQSLWTFSRRSEGSSNQAGSFWSYSPTGCFTRKWSISGVGPVRMKGC